MNDDQPPDDLDEEELEFYQLFGELRREIHDIVGTFADTIFQRVDLLQSDDERLQQPNFLDIFSTSLSSFVNIVTAWKDDLESSKDDPQEDDPPTPTPPDEDST